MRRRRNPFLLFLICVLAAPTCGVLMGELTLPAQPLDDLPALIELLRPILRLLSAPVGCLTLGLFGLVIDVALIYACAWLADGFVLSGPLYAVLTALLINAIAAVTGSR